MTELENTGLLVKEVPSISVFGTSFRIQTSLFIGDVHRVIQNHLNTKSNIKYKYITTDQLYRVVLYNNGLVYERFQIQVCCVRHPNTSELCLTALPALYVVFYTEIPGSSIISAEYNIYKELKMEFINKEISAPAQSYEEPNTVL